MGKQRPWAPRRLHQRQCQAEQQEVLEVAHGHTPLAEDMKMQGPFGARLDDGDTGISGSVGGSFSTTPADGAFVFDPFGARLDNGDAGMSGSVGGSFSTTPADGAFVFDPFGA